MKFNHFAYIFLGPKLDPKQHRSIIKTDALTFVTVGLDFGHKDQVIDIALALVSDGAQMIELCGGFGPIWIAKVSDALGGATPVGGVFYGPESRRPILDLLS